MTFDTYSEFQNASSSQKITLAVLEPARREVGWVLDTGAIYTVTFNEDVIVKVTDSGVLLSAAASTTLSSGEYFLDRPNKTLHLRTSDDANPNTKFIVVFFKQFYSDISGVAIANDLVSGFDVEFLPLLRGTSEFGVSLDNRTGAGFGIAIEGSGNIQFFNDLSYWSPRFDKFEWSNKRAFIYSWERSLPVTEAKLIYRGRIARKTWNSQRIRLSKETPNSDVPLSKGKNSTSKPDTRSLAIATPDISL